MYSKNENQRQLHQTRFRGEDGMFCEIDDLLSADGKACAPVKKGVVAIGNFDGVHRGHDVVLGTARQLAAAQAEGVGAFAMTFEPHPRTVFRPQDPVFRLTPIDAKKRLMKANAMHGVLVVPFDHAFSQMAAEAFVVDLLVEKLAVSHVVIGYDFHFGKGREGTPEFLIEMGKVHGFGVTVVPAQRTDDGALTFSSSTTREALAAGNVAAANDILGYSYFVSGEIIHGEKRGRDLGYPTANMALPPESTLKHGIYAVRVRMDGKSLPAVASFGRRPQFDNGAPLLETFIFDFSGDLYGKVIDVVFIRYLRGEAKFDGLDALIEQMDRDSENAKQALAETPPTEIDRALIL